jgi:uncharacterized membrane protein (UPF0127 family)
VAHFLSPLLDNSPDRYQLVNAATGTVIATTLLTAFDSASRRTGLLKHAALPASTALIIAPCTAIHTFFMKFPIDVIFVARDGRVVKVRRSVVPWRIAMAFSAFAVIEMAAASSTLAAGAILTVKEARQP